MTGACVQCLLGEAGGHVTGLAIVIYEGSGHCAGHFLQKTAPEKYEEWKISYASNVKIQRG